jgi:hypothetical protein
MSATGWPSPLELRAQQGYIPDSGNTVDQFSYFDVFLD